MIKKILITLGCILTITFFVACGWQQFTEDPVFIPDFPTPTKNILFLSNPTSETLPFNKSSPSTGMPTVASIFQKLPTATPFPVEPPAQTQTLTDIQILASQLYTVAVYQDSLNPSWEVQKNTGMDFSLNVSNPAHTGQSAISFVPQQVGEIEFASLFFTVSYASQEVYPRDQAARLTFWLYSGEEPLPLDQLSVAIVGSNRQPYWSADDHSVTVPDQLPVFSETRLYFLGFNYTIPADTWVPVEVDLNETLLFDPEYEYITGFYLKTEAGFSRALGIDDINLVMFEGISETPGSGMPSSAGASPTPSNRKTVEVQINTQKDVHTISELIYGVSGAPADTLRSLRPTLNSWGGNPSSRFNWQIGHAWNTGRDDNYRNENFGITSGSASDDFISMSLAAGAEVRLALPTLGWVAKNDDLNTCSFPLPDGSCGDADGASCEEPGQLADPNLANVPSYLSSVTSWVKHLVKDKSFKIRFLAMDNEPELWGFTHYDVHPKCTNYDEILKQYLMYATAVHSFAPEAELVGPMTSGWFHYWNSSAGDNDKLLHTNQDFLPWFLDKVRFNDKTKGWRSLHVLDIHFYPENVYNDQADGDNAELRLRSTRSLWDESYVDESWINEPVYLIPRLKALIEAHYPGTKLGLSEWNWGADETMNGALAIADVLGIFGREDLYYAAYSTYPRLESPGFFAFKMYTNFDNQGSRFGDSSVAAQSSDTEALSSYAAMDATTGDLHVMLVNKQADSETVAQIKLNKFTPAEAATMFRYDASQLEGITENIFNVETGNFSLNLPPYSITLLVLPPQ